MAVKYLSGNRLWGTNAERLAMTTTGSLNTATNTSWKLLGSGTGSSTDNIPCSSTFTAKDNMMILGYDKANGSGTTYSTMFFNADHSTAGGYRWQMGTDGGSVARQGDTWVACGQGQASKSGRNLNVLHFKNLSGEYRIGTSQNVFSADTGAGNNVKRRSLTWKWGDNSTALTQATISNLNGAGGGDYSEGEIIVLGCNDDETDSGTNFWQQLAFSDTITDGVLDSGTFTAKKWLMYEVSNLITGSSDGGHSLSTTFNATGDTDEYATRRSHNGGSDTSDEVSSDGILSSGAIGQQFFERGYILNRDDGEKLVILNSTAQVDTANSGDTTTLQRNEVVGKWANNAQVTSIQKKDFLSGGTDIVSGSITVYGGEA